MRFYISDINNNNNHRYWDYWAYRNNKLTRESRPGFQISFLLSAQIACRLKITHYNSRCVNVIGRNWSMQHRPNRQSHRPHTAMSQSLAMSQCLSVRQHTTWTTRYRPFCLYYLQCRETRDHRADLPDMKMESCFPKVPLPSARQHQSYGDCLEVKREYYQNCSVLDCVTQCSQSTAHLCEHFLQVK